MINQDFARKQRGDVKIHEMPPYGMISEIVAYENYGRIQAADGREVYFHRNSFLDGDFDALDIGDKVRFVEEAGEKGPQAATVQLIGKHTIAG